MADNDYMNTQEVLTGIKTWVKKEIGTNIYDISANHNGAKYANLAAALDSNNGGGVPQPIQKGGMSVKFVSNIDNKYVKFFCTANEFTTDVTKWQGVDKVPTVNSKNFVESGGVFASINSVLLYKEIANDAGVTFPFSLEKEKKYIVKNLSNLSYSLFARESASGSNIEAIVENIQPNGMSDIYTASDNYGYIRLGTNSSTELNPCKFLICEYESIVEGKTIAFKLNESGEKKNEFLYRDYLYRYTYIPFSIKKGRKVHIELKGSSDAGVRLLKDDTTVKNCLDNYNSDFVLTDDITQMWVIGGNISELLVFVYPYFEELQTKINDEAARATEAETTISNNLSDLNDKLYGKSFSNTGGGVNYPYEFLVGKVYYVRNMATDGVYVYARETEQGENIPICQNLPSGEVSEPFTTDTPLHFLRTGASGNNINICVYDDSSIKTLQDFVASNEGRNLIRTIECSDGGSGATVQLSLSKGKTYLFKNTGSVLYTLYARNTVSGDNVDVIGTLEPNEQITYIPYKDFGAVRIGANGASSANKAIAKVYTDVSTIEQVKNHFFIPSIDAVPKQNSDTDTFNLNTATTADFYAKYDTLVSAHPDFISLESTHISSNDTPLRLYSVSFPTKNKKRLVIIEAGEHGPGSDARGNSFLLYEFVRRVLEDESDFYAFIRQNYTLKVVPVTNPYGFDYGYTVPSNGRANANGVNINRNYDADWVQEVDEYGVSSGTSAASEPETQFIQSIIDTYCDEAYTFINIHSHPKDVTYGAIQYTTRKSIMYGNVVYDAWKCKYMGHRLDYVGYIHGGEATLYAIQAGIQNVYLLECLPNFDSSSENFSSKSLTSDQMLLGMLMSWK